jgi:hypothetical protein
MAGQDWDTTASLWPDKTAGLWPNKTARQNCFAELRRASYQYSHQFASIRRKSTRILTRRKSTQILMQREHTTTRLATMTKFAINYLTSNHDEIRNNWVKHPPQQQDQQQKAECRPASCMLSRVKTEDCLRTKNEDCNKTKTSTALEYWNKTKK